MIFKHPPVLATFFTLLGVVILCTLGMWQVQRMDWKSDILAKLDAVYAASDAHPLDTADFKKGDFRYGAVTGVFMPDKALLLGPRTRGGEIGNDLVVPLRTASGTILVDMGWTATTDLARLPIHHVQGKKIRFEGLARIPAWNHFTPDNEPQQNRWYKPVIAEIAAAKNLENPLPFFLYAENASYKFDAEFPNNERWQPPNNHLQYALFWFAMAATLTIVYILRFVVKKSS
jgi:surfeit locus 1 family protein